MKGENLGTKSKDIAYILGVYLGDGSLDIKSSKHLPYKAFTFQVIDEDFAEATADSLSRLVGKEVGVKPYSLKNRKYYQIYYYDYIFCSWLQEATRSKTEIPGDILQSSNKVKFEFLRGLLDSEGWVELRKDRRPSKRAPTGYLCTIGLAAKPDWMVQINDMFNELGIKTSFKKAPHCQYKYDFYTLKPRFRDFVRSGLYFTIWRKQKKVNFYTAYLRSSETACETPKQLG